MDFLEHVTGNGLLPLPQRQRVEERRAVRDRQFADIGDGFHRWLTVGLAGQHDGQNLGLESRSGTDRARHVTHEALVAFLHLFGLGLGHLALQKRQNAFEVGVVGPGPAVPVAVAHVDLVLGAFQDGFAGFGRQLVPRGVDVESEGFTEPGHHPDEVLGGVPARPRRDRAVGQCAFGIGHHEVGIDFFLDTQTRALRAGPVGRVERERSRFEVIDSQRMAVRAGQFFGEPLFARVIVVVAVVGELQHDDAVGEAEGRFDRVGEALLGRGFDGEAVDDHLDVVFFLFLESGWLGQWVHDPVDTHPAVALGVEFFEQVDELALAGADHRGQDEETGALGHREDLVDDLLRGLAGDPFPTNRTVRGARAGVEQPQVVIHLGDSADGGARVAVGRLLVDRHRRGQTFDEIDVRFVHLAEELAGVGRQRFDVATLSLGEDGVECQRRLSRPGQAGEHDQRIARQVEVDAAQVVFARAFDDQTIDHAAPFSASGHTAPMLCPVPDDVGGEQ